MATDHPGGVSGTFTEGLINGRSTANAYAAHEAQWTAAVGHWNPGGSELALAGSLGGASTPVVASPVSTDSPGGEAFSIGADWWEKVHVIPRRIALGNILSTTDTNIDIFNADRYSSRTWTAFDNGAGTGTEMVGLSLPAVYAALQGTTETFRVTLDGPGQVDDVLGYTFSGQGETNQPISFTRILAFPYPPEAGVEEMLAWLTDILEHDDGTEQRIALRDFPRQSFSFNLQRSSGPERQRVERRLFDRQHLPWGLPVWPEEVALRVAAIPTDTALLVDQTYNSDFRVGGSLILFADETTFETALITEIHPTRLILNSGLAGSWAVGSRVMPLRTAILRSFSGRRHPVNLSEHELEFLVTDNEADLAQTNWWSTVNGKLLIDDDNLTEGTASESWERRVTVFDNATGLMRQISRTDMSFRVSERRWSTKSRADLRRVRGLFYALRGQQGSFYHPTFAHDLTPVDDLSSGAVTMDVTNTGYSDYVQDRHPLDWLRVVKTDGTTIVREIVGSSVTSATVEQLTVGATWGENVAVEDIQRVEFLEEVRLAADSVTIRHGVAPGRARIGVPIRAVLS